MAISSGPEGLAVMEDVYGLPRGTINQIGPEAAAQLAIALHRDRILYGSSFIAADGTGFRRVDPNDVSPSSGA